MPEAPAFTPGTIFGGYRIEQLLGRGGMGAVYAAEQLEDGRQVAVKVLTTGHGSTEDRERFFREGRTVASINHPNTVYVYRTEEIDGLPTITMELVEGGTLEDKVKRLGPLSVAEAIKDILQIVDGLDAAERLGILHRDIKPANCFVAPSDDVKVGDFGLSRPVDQVDTDRLTQTGLFLGTPVYSSPEQLMGEALDVRSDIYAVGATLYYLLSGKLPYDADHAVRLIAVVMSGTPTPLVRHRHDIPDAVNVLVMRCLLRKREERFDDYTALRDALMECQPEEMVPAPLVRRLVAGLADSYAISAISTPLVLWAARSMGIATMDITEDPRAQWLQMAFTLPIELVWFALLEGRFGWSPGKLLLGLRVARVEGGPPGITKAALRLLVFISPGIVGLLSTLPNKSPTTRALALQFVFALVLLALFARARRSNGYMAEHDRLTGTRVVKHRRVRVAPRAAHDAGVAVSAPSASGERIGPYEVIERVPSRADVVEGFDSELRRAVWIVRQPEGTSPVSPSQRQRVRVGCLRWIGGRRAVGEAWDAYAAVPGRSLRARLAEAASWEDVHGWLKDMVSELRTREDPGAELARLSVDHVWISNEGRAILLPFAVGDDTDTRSSNGSLLQQYSVAVMGADDKTHQRDGWPLRARTLLQQAASGTDLDALHTMLDDADEHTAAMSRKSRLSLWGAIVGPTLLMGVLSLLSVIYLIPQNSDQVRMEPLLGYVATKRNRADSLAHTRTLAGAYVAGHFREAIASSNRSPTSPSGTVLSTKEWARADSILLAHPSVSADVLREADQLVDSTWHGSPPGEMNRRTMLPLFGFLGFMIFTAVLSIGAALVARRGLAMRLLGLDLVNRRQEPAGRIRLLWRQLLILTPLGMLAIAPIIFLNKSSLLWSAVVAAAFVLVVACIITALRTPSRGLTERLSVQRRPRLMVRRVPAIGSLV